MYSSQDNANLRKNVDFVTIPAYNNSRLIPVAPVLTSALLTYRPLNLDKKGFKTSS